MDRFSPSESRCQCFRATARGPSGPKKWTERSILIIYIFSSANYYWMAAVADFLLPEVLLKMYQENKARCGKEWDGVCSSEDKWKWHDRQTNYKSLIMDVMFWNRIISNKCSASSRSLSKFNYCMRG